ncbi:GntR family transcriptional regulator [Streptomyces sp. WMMC500]|uniref:GntR family transcriptional regulator n=1 Tax=Streptomyces sp. WMMC500 TaxID=3015154 RepID=UPI00248AF7B8|nr:GntR family transcriptional regulator [Streptomyces sp. WMMC500]WBB63047.1 GntR family transcriptional regulator [Streptomyces sp. WMMC500]
MLPEERAADDAVVSPPPPAPGMAPTPAPKRSALVDGVYEAVKAMVMDHRIAPGGRVGIQALARELAVSPTPVREALARLESDGLVVKRSLSGYRATELLGHRGVEELFEMRMLLEPYAAARAAEHASETQLDLLEELVEEMRGRPDLGDSYAVYGGFATLDQRFHEVIAEASGRRLLADAVERLHVHLHLFRLSPVAGASPDTLAEHRRVLRAVLRRSPERAAEAMAEHLRRSLARQRARYDARA